MNTHARAAQPPTRPHAHTRTPSAKQSKARARTPPSRPHARARTIDRLCRYTKALSRRADLYNLAGDADAELADVRLLLPTAGPRSGELRQRERQLVVSLKGATHTKRYRTILGVGAAAREDEVKKAYRALAKKFHPDKALQGGAQGQEQTDFLFKMIHEAYEELLKNPHALDDEPVAAAAAPAHGGYGRHDADDFEGFFRRTAPEAYRSAYASAWPPRGRGGRGYKQYRGAS